MKPDLRLAWDRPNTVASTLARRGYSFTYRIGAVPYCPGCAKQNWLVGRTSAECAFCGCAIPLKEGKS